MKAVILPNGRRTDLSAGVDPDIYSELENTSYSRSSPTLWCGICGSPVYIRDGTSGVRTSCSALIMTWATASPGW